MSEELDEMDLEIEQMDKLILWLWFTFYMGFFVLVLAGITVELSEISDMIPVQHCSLDV